MVGGSLATSIHGIPRTTKDIDLVAEIKKQHITPLFQELKQEFYIDPPEVIQQALWNRRMFNLIHFASSYKFDIYPLGSDAYSQAAFARRQTQRYTFDDGGTRDFLVSTPEDAMLAKLAWYRAGQQVSERQWSDVLDVVRVQRGLLDLAYLRQWAEVLGVADLLEEALRQ